jgi:anthranilate phosphoribosyltransferase
MTFVNTLRTLFTGERLNHESAREVFLEVLSGKLPAAQIAAFLTVFQTRPVSLDELEGFQKAMLERAITIDFGTVEILDLCGTGGDHKNTFNVSTLAAFVVAACGVPVAKHGNYGSSSHCGSSNVLEALGFTFSPSLDLLRDDLEKHNLCFIHAPLFHPALKVLAPVRKELGFRTIFNLLGPLANPARPRRQLIGVTDQKTANIYSGILRRQGLHFSVVFSADGYDEISLTGAWKVASTSADTAYQPEDLGFPRVEPALLAIGPHISDATKAFLNILQNKADRLQSEVIIANAGFAVAVARPEISLENCIQMAREALHSGRAFQIFKEMTTK